MLDQPPLPLYQLQLQQQQFEQDWEDEEETEEFEEQKKDSPGRDLASLSKVKVIEPKPKDEESRKTGH
jgi:hypothetical protein